MQIVNIVYLEDKLNKSKSQITEKLMERRREDVRDQMIELSSKQATGAVAAQGGVAVVDGGAAEAARQRRSAEREGRRRRRQQARASGHKQTSKVGRGNVIHQAKLFLDFVLTSVASSAAQRRPLLR